MRALGIHNAILRKAVNTHAGHVIEQEGDSWSVAFHRPMQAVAFCLQVRSHSMQLFISSFALMLRVLFGTHC